MKTSLITSIFLFLFVSTSASCGLFESSDDEIQTLRAELAVTTKSEMTVMEVENEVTTTTWELPTLPSIIDTVVSNSETEAILEGTYQWGPSSVTEALQTVLGIEADGWYGNGTRAAHLAALEERGLSTDGLPSAPTTTTEAPLANETLTEDTAELESAEEQTDEVVETTSTLAETTTTEATTETTTSVAG